MKIEFRATYDKAYPMVFHLGIVKPLPERTFCGLKGELDDVLSPDYLANNISDIYTGLADITKIITDLTFCAECSAKLTLPKNSQKLSEPNIDYILKKLAE